MSPCLIKPQHNLFRITARYTREEGENTNKQTNLFVFGKLPHKRIVRMNDRPCSFNSFKCRSKRKTATGVKTIANYQNPIPELPHQVTETNRQTNKLIFMNSRDANGCRSRNTGRTMNQTDTRLFNEIETLILKKKEEEGGERCADRAFLTKWVLRSVASESETRYTRRSRPSTSPRPSIEPSVSTCDTRSARSAETLRAQLSPPISSRGITLDVISRPCSPPTSRGTPLSSPPTKITSGKAVSTHPRSNAE